MNNTERRVPQQIQPKLETEAAKRNLIDRRAISKKHDPAGRETTAATVLSVKDKIIAIRKTIAGKETVLLQKEQKSAELDSRKTEKVLTLDKQLETIIVRFKKALRIKDEKTAELQVEIITIENELDQLATQAGQIRQELEGLTQEQAKLPDPKKLLDAYYEKMETVPLSNEEKRELLTPEVLSSLSMEEYTALWRRLNPHFLSHVTRQGFRDHYGMMSHSGGREVFHDGLVGVLADKKMLRPPMAISNGLLARDEDSIRTYLEGWVLQAENKDDADERLFASLNNSLAAAPNYPDKTAVHFAAQTVLDGFYGGEKNTEVFFLYPSDFLASQHDFTFNGSEKDFTQPQSDDTWNDVFVWPPTVNDPGISIDAGVVFLPTNAPVDAATGSKYDSKIVTVEKGEKKEMVEDEKFVNQFIQWAASLTEGAPLLASFKEHYRNTSEPNKKRQFYDVLRNELAVLGFCGEAVADLSSTIAKRLYMVGRLQLDQSTDLEEEMRELIRQSGANWKRAENTISSKEYWETYFTQHPEQRPKHVVYYDGDPTGAVYKWQQENNIGRADVSKTEGKLLGFDDRQVTDMKHDPRAYKGYDEMVAMGKKIIAEHYDRKAK